MRKNKPPSNYLKLLENGTALWEVWWDDGDGTPASPVAYEDLDNGRTFFLNDGSAAKVAKRLATEQPDHRFAVKQVEAVAVSELVKAS